MTQLLQVTTTPIKYEMQVERARLEIRQKFQPEGTVSHKNAQLNLEATNTRVQLDTYEMRRSLGFASPKDLVADAAQKGRENITEKTREYTDIGRQMSETYNGTTIADIYRQKMLEQPSSYTAFLPNGGTQISWIPAGLKTDYQEGYLDHSWNVTPPTMDYVPGSFHVEILQYPSINVEYLGGPHYVPPSAAPDYVAPEG